MKQSIEEFGQILLVLITGSFLITYFYRLLEAASAF